MLSIIDRILMEKYFLPFAMWCVTKIHRSNYWLARVCILTTALLLIFTTYLMFGDISMEVFYKMNLPTLFFCGGIFIFTYIFEKSEKNDKYVDWARGALRVNRFIVLAVAFFVALVCISWFFKYPIIFGVLILSMVFLALSSFFSSCSSYVPTKK